MREKTIIYLRVSTQEQNPKNQLRDCQRINSYGEAEVIQEQQSAFKDVDRDKFSYIISEIKKGNVRRLICWDLDRLYRNRKKLIEFFEFCKLYDCKIHSYRQQWLEQLHKIPEPFNEIVFNLMLQIMGWISEEESKKRSERVKIAFKNSSKKWGRKPMQNKDKRIIKLHKEGVPMREIAKQVHYWDKNRNRKFVSKSYVHNIIKKFTHENS
jgi:DNA invertase Pin-like site-specific DNA recombinase